ncbi:DNA cytosine methyltransferase [Chitinophaga sp. sic0106]|uniref:DNA cytosine methyltransferase n=1 Tax=Chitinophaga sp. sic0106 TaxID=2854785 RepID=UPI001C44505D|nr:DNA cytosine methyltransferase [Chitinophaga sp. sic0106]MBV7530464.1 DNA cytosine methyltransferase [Chitinophaga sp. sic0106]
MNNREIKGKSEIANSVKLPKIISLFCGAGGLDLGFIQEGFEVVAAIDLEQSAIETHKKNFPKCNSIASDLTVLGPKGVNQYIKKFLTPGEHVAIIGGPPCQGFSRSNPTADSEDPRNHLPKLYVQIIRELQKDFVIDFVVFENVLGMKDRKHSAKYLALIKGLKRLKFEIFENELCAVDYGVPQNRERIVIAAIRSSNEQSEFKIEKNKGIKTVREAIGNLGDPVYFKKNITASDIPFHPNHWTMQPKSVKFKTPMKFNSKSRSFKLLDWDKASPTIAFGNREIHIHPSGKRRLSIYEAMLLQGFPSSFILEGNLSQQVKQVSNAVPPPLAKSVAAAVKSSLHF